MVHKSSHIWGFDIRSFMDTKAMYLNNCYVYGFHHLCVFMHYNDFFTKS